MSPARIAVNGRFRHAAPGGVARYSQSISGQLNGRAREIVPARRLRGAAGHAWEQVVLPRLVRPGEALWSPANSGPLLCERQAITIHDLSPLDHPEWFKPDFARWYKWLWPRLLPGMRAILTPSKFSKQRVVDHFKLDPGSVFVIPGGTGPAFQPSSLKAQRQTASRYRLPARYILFVGALEPRKNLPGLLAAWELIHNDLPGTELILAGTHGHVFRQQDLGRLPQGVRLLGYVPDTHLVALYSGALALALPSFYEGFGLTALEGMACGAPVICSRIPALVELAGDAALYVDPLDVDSIAVAICRVAASPGLRETLSARGLERARRYSWEASARAVQQMLSSLAI
jgi:glycosyltransferase involved in cell wall biosynthesis